MRRCVQGVVTAVFAVFCLGVNGCEPRPGYSPRANGFDLDGDGRVGRPADRRVCDGWSTDLDGNGVVDRSLYVDCDAGNDGGAGTPEQPLRSIARAMQFLGSPAEGQIQAVCFSGVCRETIRPSQNGAPGSRLRDGFEVPTYPLIVSGWDRDGDGIYPPRDRDDRALLDGSSGGSLHFAVEQAPARSYVEYAHFSVRDFGSHSNQDAGLFRPALQGDRATHVYMHDVEAERINAGRTQEGGRIAFHLFPQGALLHHLLISNVSVKDYGSYLIRGEDADRGEELGPYRFERLTATALGSRRNHAAGIKIWGEVSRIDVLKSRFDASPRRWEPCESSTDVAGCEPTYAISVGPCSREWRIEGNLFRDWKRSVAIQPDVGSGACQSRDIDRVRLEGNRFENTYEPWRFGDVGIHVMPGNTVTVRDVSIVNNFFWAPVGMEACIWSQAGTSLGSQSGQIQIVNNTCSLPTQRHASLLIGTPADENGSRGIRQQNYLVYNNVFTGLQPGQANIETTYVPAQGVFDGNVYDPGGHFVWANTIYGTLDGWRSASGHDASSRVCRPTFRGFFASDLHLSPRDQCAIDAGIGASWVTTSDLDGQRRAEGLAWDVGADEIIRR